MTVKSDIGQFGMVPLWLLETDISSTGIRLFAVMAAKFADRNGQSFPGRKTLAAALGGKSPRTVDNALVELKRVGAVTVTPRSTPEGDLTSNLYTLHFVAPPGANNSMGSAENHATGRAENHATGLAENCGENHTQDEPDPEGSRGDPPRPVGAGRGGPAPARGDENGTEKIPRAPHQQTGANLTLEQIQREWGQPVVHWPKEAGAIKAGLGSGYTHDQIIGCWRAAQKSPRWNGQWMPMAFLVEDVGEFVKSGLVRKWEVVAGRRLSGQPRYRDYSDYPKEW